MTKQDYLDRGWGNWDLYDNGTIVFQKDQEKEVFFELTTRLDSPNMTIKRINKMIDPVYSPETRQVIFTGMCHFPEHFDLLCMLLKITPYNKDVFPISIENFKH